MSHSVFIKSFQAVLLATAVLATSNASADIVISGINHGANMGDDTLYSGTVAAATEAYLLGIPAVAFSLHDKTERYFHTAEKVAWEVIPDVAENIIRSYDF